MLDSLPIDSEFRCGLDVLMGTRCSTGVALRATEVLSLVRDPKRTGGLHLSSFAKGGILLFSIIFSRFFLSLKKKTPQSIFFAKACVDE